ncbi:hypothetical protein ACIRS3_34925 [Streptomyces virginiae]|uniref:hypothetical protein n=1 Tax=Streptomyces virginiae TaxID=1961 RepID=UPI00380A0D9C
MKWWPATGARVDDLVLLGSRSHGAAEGNLSCVLPCAPAGTQTIVGSNFLHALNTGDETPGTPDYTSLYSRSDELVLPFTTAPLDGAKNIALQNICPGRVVTHGGLLSDALTHRLVIDALTHTGPADPARLPAGKCTETLATVRHPRRRRRPDHRLQTRRPRPDRRRRDRMGGTPLKPYAH